MRLPTSARPSRVAGLSLGGFVLVMLGFCLVAYLGMKIIPCYIEYHGVVRSLNEMKGQHFASKRDVNRALSEKFSVNYVTSVTPDDIDIETDGEGWDISVDYDVTKTLAGNLSLVAHFDYDVTTGSGS